MESNMIKKILIVSLLVLSTAYANSVENTTATSTTSTQEVSDRGWNLKEVKKDSGESCKDGESCENGNCLSGSNCFQKGGPMHTVFGFFRDRMKEHCDR